MAKQRVINTKFWDDSYIANLSHIEKLLFLYVLTNPLTNISGVYELPLRRVAFDVGMREKDVQEVFRKFEKDGKLAYIEGWMAVKNWIRYQTLNPKVKQGIILELKKVPEQVRKTINVDMDTLFRGVDTESKRDRDVDVKRGGIGHISSFMPKMV